MMEENSLLSFTTAEGKGGRPIFVAGGYLYHTEKVIGPKTYTRCHRWRSGCLGRAILDTERTVVLTATDHNGDHSSDEKEILLRQFRALLKQNAEACLTGNMKEQYDKAAAELPAAAVHLTYVQASRCMNEWRRRKWPRNPKDAKATLEVFQHGASKCFHLFPLLTAVPKGFIMQEPRHLSHATLLLVGTPRTAPTSSS